MEISELLTDYASATGRLAHRRVLPAQPPRTGAWPGWITQSLRDHLKAQGINNLWEHQIYAADAAHADSHLILTSGTGSGKSLPVWLTVLAAQLEALAAAQANPGSIATYRRRPTALYLAPTKALAADQLGKLRALLGATASPATPDIASAGRAGESSSGGALRDGLTAFVCDGDTPREEKDLARAAADTILSNPDFLHYSMLPNHERYARFLAGLRWIIIDELHVYRGLFGAHVAMVLRRLRRLARHHGADPRVLAMSATVADPARALARLAGISPSAITEVSQDTSPRGEKTILLCRQTPLATDSDTNRNTSHDAAAPRTTSPSETGGQSMPVRGPAGAGGPEPDGPEPEGAAEPATSSDKESATRDSDDDAVHTSTLREAARMTALAVTGGARTLTFIRSRAGTEALAEIANSYLETTSQARIRAYRGGYLPEERRALEADISAGRIGGLASTSALELGVDISGLDATISCGWPGTRASFFQQIGRAGRAGKAGTAVLLAQDNPLDAYLIDHPEAIFEQVWESPTFDPTNPFVRGPHLCAAAKEVPLTEADFPLFGLRDDAVLREFEKSGLLVRRPSGWYWPVNRRERPTELASLRGSGFAQILIVEQDSGTVLGTVDHGRADASLHPGAIYLHQGKTFQVEDLGEEVAAVVPIDNPNWRTRAISERTVTLTGSENQLTFRSGPSVITVRRGPVEVISQVTGYTTIMIPTGISLGVTELEMPVRTLPTAGTWWTYNEAAIEAAGVSPDELPGALHAAEHAAIGLLPLFATCDRWDIGGLSTRIHPQTGLATIIIHDALPGGADNARRGFEALGPWLSATARHVRECPCERGCPRCIHSPKCGSNNEPLSKAGAIALLEHTVAVFSGHI